MFNYISKLIKEWKEGGDGAPVQITTAAGGFIGEVRHHPDIAGLFLFSFDMEGPQGAKRIEMSIEANNIIFASSVDRPPRAQRPGSKSSIIIPS